MHDTWNQFRYIASYDVCTYVLVSTKRKLDNGSSTLSDSAKAGNNGKHTSLNGKCLSIGQLQEVLSEIRKGDNSGGVPWSISSKHKELLHEVKYIQISVSKYSEDETVKRQTSTLSLSSS
jgi:hypothetical protein